MSSSYHSDEERKPLSRRELLRRAALATGGLALAAPAGAAPTPPGRKPGAPAPGAATPGTPNPSGFADKDIDEVVKGFDKLGGVLTLYRKKNDLYAEVRPEQLGQNMLLQTTRATGTAGAGGTVGEPLDDTVFALQKENDQIYLVAPNLRFRAKAKTPEAVSVRRSFADAYVAAFKIEAIRPDPKKAKEIAAIKDKDQKAEALEAAAVGYLIHIPTLFLTDVPGFTLGMPGYSVDAEKTYLKNVQNFPDNLVVTTMFHFAGRPGGLGRFGGVDTLTDDRSIPQQVVYNLFPLKDTGYAPRLYDDRIGYFTEDYETFDEDTSEDNTRRMIQRWHLVKKDPKAALSEPVKPIVFWVDNATPLRYRDAVREGVLAWNAAFARIGYKDAVQCEVMPEDADWDPADMRHNVVRWMSSPGAGYAVAQFRHNPLTGEIVNASISVDASWARFTNLSYPATVLNGQTPQQYADTLMNAKPADVAQNRCTCSLGAEMQMTSAFGWDSLEMLADADAGLAPGEKKPSLEEFTHMQLRHVVMHEMGHCLGLRHNFKGSTMLTPAQLQDRKMTGEYGIMGSIMDYGGPNLAPLGGKQGDWFMDKPGPYDQWAIAYGYTDFGGSAYDEIMGLKAIASRSREFGHDFASDENADTIDPTITRYDLSADPLTYRVAMVEKSHHMLALLEFRTPAYGESYFSLTRRFRRLLGQHNGNALAVARFVGGIITERNHYGDKDAVPPVRPVPFADQRRALAALCTWVFADAALRFSPALLERLQQDPAPFGPLTSVNGMTQDLSILDTIAGVQAAGLYAVLNPGTLGRIETNEYRAEPGHGALSVLETINTVTAAVWSDLNTHPRGAPLTIRPLRRRLQRTYVDAVVALAHPAEGRTPTGDAGAFALASLNALAVKLAAAEKRASDPVTAAHLSEMHLRVRRFLHAQAIV